MGYLFIAATILFTIYGQLVLYWRVSSRGIGLSGFNREEVTGLLRVLMDPWVLSGFGAAFIASIFYMIALSRFQLNHAYPFMSLTFPLVAVCSHFLFGDLLPARKVLGLGIIITGIIVGSQGGGN
jgi:multidrug transporter EmrE-like cation transporter